MSNQNAPQRDERNIGFWDNARRRVRLVLRLIRDERVPLLLKGLPLLSVLYFISPIDLLPALLLGPLAPLGALDDVALLWLLSELFISVCPPDVVAEHKRELEALRERFGHDAPADTSQTSTSNQTPPVIEGEYQLVDDES